MKLYANARMLSSEDKSFQARDTGETISYATNILKGAEDGGVLELNSKAVYEEHEGKVGIAVVKARVQNDGMKLTLVDFIVGETFEIPEGEIE